MTELCLIGQFSRAASKSSSHDAGPVMKMNEAIFHQILGPIHQIMINDPVYADIDISIDKQVEELRQICSEVQMRHATDDYILKARRGELLNILQNILENTEPASGGALVMEGNDLLALSNLTDIIRGGAKIYREFMKAPLIADALYNVADNIDKAQSRLWKPGIGRNCEGILEFSYVQTDLTSIKPKENKEL